jgi:hypothetical protein
LVILYGVCFACAAPLPHVLNPIAQKPRAQNARFNP